MKKSRTAVGGVMLEAFEGWKFWDQDGVIAGRRHGDEGILRIKHVAHNELPQRLTHAKCLEIATRLMAVPAGKGTSRLMLESISGPYGAATFNAGKDLLRLWYCCRPAGLIVGVYACPLDLSRDAAYRFISGQCAHIMATAIFNRPSWGGSDPLTRVLLGELETAEAQRSDVAPVPPPPAPAARAARRR